MKKFLAVLILVLTTPCLASAVLLSTPSDTKRVKVYDQHGSYLGKQIQTENGKTKYYGKYGSYEGYSVKNGSKTKYYNKYGQFEGYSKDQPSTNF